MKLPIQDGKLKEIETEILAFHLDGLPSLGIHTTLTH